MRSYTDITVTHTNCDIEPLLPKPSQASPITDGSTCRSTILTLFSPPAILFISRGTHATGLNEPPLLQQRPLIVIITHTHIPLSPALTGHLGPLGQDWHKLLRGVVRPEPPLFCPEGAGETARQGSGGNHTLVRREDTAHLWGRGGAGDGKKRVTRQPPARTPGAPEHWSRTHEPPPRPGSAAGTAAFARP